MYYLRRQTHENNYPNFNSWRAVPDRFSLIYVKGIKTIFSSAMERRSVLQSIGWEPTSAVRLFYPAFIGRESILLANMLTRCRTTFNLVEPSLIYSSRIWSS